VHLGPDLVVHALCYPFLSHNAPILPDVTRRVCWGTAGEKRNYKTNPRNLFKD